jgi:AcrR family transcriptional regulator
MTSKQPDRRVDKSKRALADAMVQLMVEKGYEEATVADIAERANVGRSTFYAHYADKEDLLREMLEGLRLHISHAVAAVARSGVHPALVFSLPMLEHVGEVRELCAAIVNRRSAARELVHAMLVELVSDVLRAQPSQVSDASKGVPVSLAAEHIVGSFLAVCHWWLFEANTLKAAEVDTAFCQLMAGI